MRQQLLGKLGRGALVVLAVNTTGIFLSFGVQVVFARLLGPTELGEYAFALSWLSIAVLVGLGGADSVTIREVSASVVKGESARLARILSWGKWNVIRNTLVVSALLTLGTISFAKELRAPFLWGALLIPFWALSTLRQSVCRGFQMMLGTRVPEIILRPIFHGVLLCAAMLVLHHGASSGMLMGTHTISAALALICGWIAFRPPVEESQISPPPHDENTLTWNREGRKIAAISLMMVLWNELDKITLGLFTSFEIVGVYAVAARVAALTSFGSDAVASIAAPLLAQHVATRSTQDLEKLLGRITLLTMAASIPVALVTIFAGPFILPIFGAKFAAGYLPLCILCVGNAWTSIYGLAGYALIMSGKDSLLLVLTLRAVLVLLVLITLGTYFFGAPGAAAGAALGNIFKAWSMKHAVQKEFNLNLSLQTAARHVFQRRSE